MQVKNNSGQLISWHKGYGFIKFGNRTVFVHRDSYLRGFVPEIGQVVAFDFKLSIVSGRPPQATNVRVLKSAQVYKEEQELERLLRNSQGGAL